MCVSILFLSGFQLFSLLLQLPYGFMKGYDFVDYLALSVASLEVMLFPGVLSTSYTDSISYILMEAFTCVCLFISKIKVTFIRPIYRFKAQN